MVPDYELAATVEADTPEKMRAIVDPLRTHILDLVMDRAATVTELALALHRPKSSLAYHVDVLLEVGMLQVVRTRRVRAIEEKFYGRTGRTIVFDEQRAARRRGGPELPRRRDRRGGAGGAGDALDAPSRPDRPERLHEFFDRVDLLAEEFTMLPREGDVVFGFIAAVYPTAHPMLPEVATPSPDATLATVAAVPPRSVDEHAGRQPDAPIRRSGTPKRGSGPATSSCSGRARSPTSATASRSSPIRGWPRPSPATRS